LIEHLLARRTSAHRGGADGSPLRPKAPAEGHHPPGPGAVRAPGEETLALVESEGEPGGHRRRRSRPQGDRSTPRGRAFGGPDPPRTSAVRSEVAGGSDSIRALPVDPGNW
jgi:hypothetical protein